VPLRWTPRLRRSPPKTASTGGRSVYAIGDVHGCSDLLANLLAEIRKDAEGLTTSDRPAVVFVGDYVDRGPDSKGVVERVIELRREGRFEVRALKGNHEETLIAFLGDPAVGPAWADFGGLATLESYGVASPALKSDLGAWARASEALAASLPAEHLAFLTSLELTASYGDYLFVHAGVRPGTPLQAQREHDLLWIRDEFLRAKEPCAQTVVHGHTPEAEPFVGRHRIGIDTGAYATGVLTAVRLHGTERKIIQARAPRARSLAAAAADLSARNGQARP
jgi:serine/threonine protein phosphatase 1